jgi:hypothetical protein
MQRYKVFYHSGQELDVKTRVKKGEALLTDSELRIADGAIVLSRRNITSTRLFRLHGLGRVVQIDHSAGRLYIAVVRAMIGQFAFINFFRTGDLFERLQSTPLS